MESPEEAEAAIAALSGTELLGKTITIEKTNVPTTLVHMIAATLMNILAVDAIVLAPEIVTMADEGREITTMIAKGMTENGAIPGGIEIPASDTILKFLGPSLWRVLYSTLPYSFRSRH
ncbi:hypothetical protein AAF712_008046 [Marasmius tenuissimus]|uniref:Uncharacterized protein n=1 Tax=Marasmius tenuissimus TaxID=585030 RepID=A0ABR2ZV44_9AGAR